MIGVKLLYLHREHHTCGFRIIWPLIRIENEQKVEILSQLAIPDTVHDVDIEYRLTWVPLPDDPGDSTMSSGYECHRQNVPSDAPPTHGTHRR